MDGISKLENQFAKLHNNKYAVAVNSGTSALILAVKALRIKKGDEVIVPDFTMISTAWAVNYNNAKPVFVDCDDSLNINIAANHPILCLPINGSIATPYNLCTGFQSVLKSFVIIGIFQVFGAIFVGQVKMSVFFLSNCCKHPLQSDCFS